jgi:hypothetical protein
MKLKAGEPLDPDKWEWPEPEPLADEDDDMLDTQSRILLFIMASALSLVAAITYVVLI